jgi:hypothetical protein
MIMLRLSKVWWFVFLRVAAVVFFSCAVVGGQEQNAPARTAAGNGAGSFRVAGTVVNSITGTPLGKTRGFVE